MTRALLTFWLIILPPSLACGIRPVALAAATLADCAAGKAWALRHAGYDALCLEDAGAGVVGR